jgi:hypothetical protein
MSSLRELLSAPPSDRQVAGLAALPRGFYERDAETVALDLLGKLLVRELPDGRAVVRLTERDGVRYAKALRPSKMGRIVAANRFVEGLAGRAFAVAACDPDQAQTNSPWANRV